MLWKAPFLRAGFRRDIARTSVSVIITIMAVYVDNLRNYGWRHGPSCHLIADSVEELIEFAVAMGLRREWFQPKSSPHFDLTAEGRAAAVLNGAIEINQRQLVIKLRELREKRLQLIMI